VSGDHAPAGGLAALAGALGVEAAYWDVRGERHHASPATVVAIARASGVALDDPGPGGWASDGGDRTARAACDQLARQDVEQGLPPVVVAWDGEPTTTGVWVPHGLAGAALAVLALEDGDRHRWEVPLDAAPEVGAADDLVGSWARAHGWRRLALPLPAGLPIGYHELVLARGGTGGREREHRATVIVAPRRAAEASPWERTWGVFAPLHAVRRAPGDERGPDLGDLERLAAWTAGRGGRVVGTLPLLATFLDRPHDPSPYAPVSRRFWNEAYLDLDRLPGAELADAPPPAPAPAAATDPAAGPPGGEAAPFDARARQRRVRAAAGAVADALGDRLTTLPAYQAFAAAHPDVEGYAAFRAAAEQAGTGWHGWAPTARGGTLAPGDQAPGAARFHRYAQWALHEQLGGLAAGLRAREQRLYLDLPVGSHADGYDTWRQPHLFAWGVDVGAPPDEFFELGQRWGFPPLVPRAARQDGHRFLASCVRAHLRVAGLLRLDHVMQLHRLFWVPGEVAAADGAYVRYPREELFAVLAVESHRAGCPLVGEDLGTVPDEVRAGMADHGLQGMYVLQFEVPADGGAPRPAPPGTVASLNTHDTPTFASWLVAGDVDRSLALGLVDDERAAEIRAHRLGQVAALRATLGAGDDGGSGGGADAAALAGAALVRLGASEATTVLVTLDDLWAGLEPQNVPGTGVDRPNWVHRWPTTLAELAADDGVAAALDRLQAARLGAYQSAVDRLGPPPDADLQNATPQHESEARP
jgi:4-alpha-glucanotransferase